MRWLSPPPPSFAGEAATMRMQPPRDTAEAAADGLGASCGDLGLASDRNRFPKRGIWQKTERDGDSDWMFVCESRSLSQAFRPRRCRCRARCGADTPSPTRGPRAPARTSRSPSPERERTAAAAAGTLARPRRPPRPPTAPGARSCDSRSPDARPPGAAPRSPSPALDTGLQAGRGNTTSPFLIGGTTPKSNTDAGYVCLT